jgi:hypothetical protein
MMWLSVIEASRRIWTIVLPDGTVMSCMIVRDLIQCM